jgi:hypothetical protein
VVKLFKAGDQVPVILLIDVAGKGVIESPGQMVATDEKVGVILGFTVMLVVVVVAHNPAVGVNV